MVLSRSESACLLIADISGYTSYLAGAELDHAQDILADLMTTVVGALRPGFRLAKLEGDAAFVYVLTERVDGSQLLDTVERTYFAFRRRLRDIAQATSCPCNACTLMPRLDLKVIAHHGSIIRHRVAGREELVGSDVIVAHRFLKNHVVERLGLSAYALFSQACIAAMDADPVALGMTEYRDTDDDLGAMRGWVHDLGSAWTAELERRRRIVTEREAGFILDATMPAPPDIVWSFLTDPAIRPQWQAGVTEVDQLPTTPRRGAGTTNHCMHGADLVVEEILDWRPTDYVTHRTTLSSGLRATSSYVLEGGPDGTRLRGLFTWGKSKRKRDESHEIRAFLSEVIGLSLTQLSAVLAAEMDRRAALAAEAPAEPVAPASQDRELLEPVRR
jgi:uncharacterized protein YndB with AHSA1/START domain